MLSRLADIVSTCPNRNDTDPLLAIVTNDNLEPVAVDGVRWILGSWYYHEEYDGSENEYEKESDDNEGKGGDDE